MFSGLVDCDYAAVNALGQPGLPPYTHVAMMQQVALGVWVAHPTEKWPIPGAPVNTVPNLFLPMMGVFDAGTRLANGKECAISGFDKQDTWAALTLQTTGGWCSAEGMLGENQLEENLTVNLDYLELQQGNNKVNEVPFGTNLSSLFNERNLLGDFGPDCLQNLQDACMIVNISAITNCNDMSTPGKPLRRTATCEVCFDVRNSCFAAGTMIRRADGAIVPVETVEAGDLIIANESGTPLTVTATTRGTEIEPVVRLKTSLGHELMLTSKHLVITTLGAVPAEQITTMSQVYTEDGIASIVEVERVRYDGIVYNLSVGTPEEIAMASGIDRTLFAGGIRVGDNEMQFDMERASVRASAVRTPHPAWEIDRKNAMERQQRAQK